MTVAEQLAIQNHRGKLYYVGRGIVIVIALSVIIMAITLARVNTKASNTASQANQTANLVKSVLGQSVVAICKSRQTTLRTAPQTVKEFRAINDAQSPEARKVCPNIDYAGIKRERLAEIDKLEHGADPEVIARS